MGYHFNEGTAHKFLFPTFFKLMLNEMDRHHPRNGDDWLDSNFVKTADRDSCAMEEWLDILIKRAAEDYEKTKDPAQLEDIANLCAMRRLRGILMDALKKPSQAFQST